MPKHIGKESGDLVSAVLCYKVEYSACSLSSLVASQA